MTTTYPVNTTVTVNGQALNTTATGYPDQPTVLSPLAVTWGRNDTFTQPDSSTCTFTVSAPLDQAQAAWEQLAPGGRLTVDSHICWADQAAPRPDNLLALPTAAAYRGLGAPFGVIDMRSRQPLTPAGLTYTPSSSSSFLFVCLVPDNPLAGRWDTIPPIIAGHWDASVLIEGLPAGTTAQLTLNGFEQRPGGTASYAGPYMRDYSGTNAPRPTTSEDGLLQVSGDVIGTAGTVIGTITANVAAAYQEPRWPAIGVYIPRPDDGWPIGTRITLSQPTLAVDENAWGRTSHVFTGRISSTTLTRRSRSRAQLKVVATDWLTDLQNLPVGAPPWTVDNPTTRIIQAAQAAGYSAGATWPRTGDLGTGTVRYSASSGLSSYKLAPRDSDSTNLLTLLTEIADSVGLVIRTAIDTDGTEYVVLHDPADRPPYGRAVYDDTGNLTAAEPSPSAIAVSAAEVIADARLVRDMTSSTSRVEVVYIDSAQWLPAGGAQPETFEATAVVEDAAAVAKIGRRTTRVRTMLRGSAPANQRGADILAQRSPDLARLPDIQWDSALALDQAPEQRLTLYRLTDAAHRFTATLAVLGSPPWFAPPALFVIPEGGTLTLEAGRWTSTMAVSQRSTTLATGAKWLSPPASLTWQKTQISWAEFKDIDTI